MPASCIGAFCSCRSSPRKWSRLPFRELQVCLAEPVDEDTHEGLVEADLAGVGGGAQGGRLDFDDGDLLDGDDGGGAPPGGAGEVEDLAEAAAGLDGVERLAEQGHADLAFDQEVEAVALV